MNVTIDHPTDRPNFTIVQLGSVAIGFSYKTPIAVFRPTYGWTVRENLWGPITEKHLNHFDDGNKSKRVDSATFEALLGEVTA